MNCRSCFVLFSLLLMATCGLAAPSLDTTPFRSETRLPAAGLDELDTFADSLSYYNLNDSLSSSPGGISFYVQNRFTTPDEYQFELQSVGMYYSPGDTLPVGHPIYLYEDAGGQPGDLITMEYVLPTIVEGDLPYLRFEFEESDYVTLPPGTDFWISVHAGALDYRPNFDEESTESRSWIGLGDPGTQTEETPGDWLISAIGVSSVDGVDLVVDACYNESGRWHGSPNSTLHPLAVVRNQGDETATGGLVTFSTTSLNGDTTVTQDVDLPDLAPGETVDVEIQVWPLDGQQVFEATASHPDDVDPSNNSGAFYYQTVDYMGDLYRIDDGSAEASVDFANTLEFGNAYMALGQDMTVDGMQLVSPQAMSATIRVHTMTQNNYHTGLHLEQEVDLVEGFNEVSFDPVPIPPAQFVLVTVQGHVDATWPLDTSTPVAALNDFMPVSSVSVEGETITDMTVGNLMIRAHITRTTIPRLVFPDTVQAGVHDIHETVLLEVPIENTGLSTFPIGGYDAYDENRIKCLVQMPYYLNGGETWPMPFLWTHNWEGEYTRSLLIYHNDPNLPNPVTVHVHGTSLPTQVSLDIAPNSAPPLSFEQGNNLDFHYELYVRANDLPTPLPYTMTLWTEVVLPNGNTYGPIAQATLPLAEDAELYFQDLPQAIPPFAPVGDYEYHFNIGLGGPALDSDMMPFTVVAGPETDGAANGDWSSPELQQAFDIAAGKRSAAIASESGASLPAEFALGQAYPNPFNPTASIQVDLPTRADLHVRVVDVLGRQVMELAGGTFAAGSHSLVLDGSNLASGIYFVHATVPGELNVVRKVTLMK